MLRPFIGLAFAATDSPLALLILFLFFPAEPPSQQPAPLPRRYAQGPLRSPEFRGKIADHAFADAETQTRVMIDYKFKTQASTDGTLAKLTSVEIYSIFLPEASWWRPSADPRLLDHEQGHFDIAEISARRLQLTFSKSIATSRIVGSGPNVRHAEKDLAQKINKVFQKANDQAVFENEEYDRRTAHGLQIAKQAEWRRVQQATLSRLEKQLRASVKAKRAATR